MGLIVSSARVCKSLHVITEASKIPQNEMAWKPFGLDRQLKHSFIHQRSLSLGELYKHLSGAEDQKHWWWTSMEACWHLFAIPSGCDWSHPKMTSPKNKAKKKPPKDSMTLLPCFYFVEVCVGWMCWWITVVKCTYIPELGQHDSLHLLSGSEVESLQYFV